MFGRRRRTVVEGCTCAQWGSVRFCFFFCFFLGVVVAIFVLLSCSA